MEQLGGRFFVSDTADRVVPRGLCTRVDDHKASCPLYFPFVKAGDGNDIVEFDNDVVPVGGTQIHATLEGEACRTTATWAWARRASATGS